MCSTGYGWIYIFVGCASNHRFLFFAAVANNARTRSRDSSVLKRKNRRSCMCTATRTLSRNSGQTAAGIPVKYPREKHHAVIILRHTNLRFIHIRAMTSAISFCTMSKYEVKVQSELLFIHGGKQSIQSYDTHRSLHTFSSFLSCSSQYIKVRSCFSNRN